MTDLHQLQFYATPEHSCSYLEARLAKTIFVDPGAKLDPYSYSQLSELGFRRSGNHVYRPHCDNCSACISARVPVQLFRPGRGQKRVLNLNKDLRISSKTPSHTDEYYALYERYISARHHDGDMFPASQQQFESFLVQSEYQTRFIEYRLDQTLLAVSVVDYLEQGLSAIYTFFDPDQQRRSLGKLAILALIQQACSDNLPYLYLGYWVHGCQKMSYKINFQPIQLLIDDHWIHLPKGEPKQINTENILRRT